VIFGYLTAAPFVAEGWIIGVNSMEGHHRLATFLRRPDLHLRASGIVITKALRLVRRAFILEGGGLPELPSLAP